MSRGRRRGGNLGRVVAVRRHGAHESCHARSRRGCHGGSVRAVSSHAVGNGWGPRVVVSPVERGCCNTSSPFPRAAAPPQAARVLPRASLRDHGRGPRRGAPRAARGPADLPGTRLRRCPSGLVTSAHPAGPSPRRCADRAASRPGPLPALRGDPGAVAGMVCAPARLRRRGRRRGPGWPRSSGRPSDWNSTRPRPSSRMPAPSGHGSSAMTSASGTATRESPAAAGPSTGKSR